MINFYLFNYNSIKFIDYQVKSIRKFITDKEYEIYLTIDASDDNMRYQMNNVADNLNIKKINMPIPHLGWNLTHTTDSTENGGIIIQDVGEITIQKLKEFEIPYHGVTFWQTICKFLYR